MSRGPLPSFLDEMLALLVRQFGAERIRRALDSIAVESVHGGKAPKCSASLVKRNANPSIKQILEDLRTADEAKYRLVIAFYNELKDQRLLPESQDIRQFAQIIGLKEITGKSRRDLIPKLIRFLVGMPKERLQVDLPKAAGISEQERQRGFSVLTDKLLNETRDAERGD